MPEAADTGTTLLGAPDAPAQGQPPAAVATAAPATPVAEGQAAAQGNNQPGEQPAAEAAALDLGKIALADGRKLDEGLLNEFKPLAEAMGIKQDQAQQLVGLFDKAQQSAYKQSIDAFEQMKTDWLAQVRADPVIGGPRLLETTAMAAKAIRLAGGPELQKVLNETGMGNHPAFVKAFSQLGRLISSDSTGTATEGDPSAKPRDAADVMYGTK